MEATEMAQRIAVLMGGRSLERDVSLHTGKRIVESLNQRGYNTVALDLVPELVDSLRSERPDAAYLAVRGRLGEDGTIQELLEILGVPYTGSGVLASILAWDKDLCKRILRERGIRTPPWVVFSASGIKEMGAVRALDLVGRELGGPPFAVKPSEQGSALGLSKVESVGDLGEAMLSALAYDTKVIVEKWIAGTEVAVSLLDGPSGLESLPPVEVVPLRGLHDYNAMYTPGLAEYFIPARVPQAGLDAAVDSARATHVALGCRDMSRVDIVVSARDGQPYVLECNTLPGLTETSLFPMCAEAGGIAFDDLVERLAKAALSRKSA
jgi:D-alanine-D-alanine ligase